MTSSHLYIQTAEYTSPNPRLFCCCCLESFNFSAPLESKESLNSSVVVVGEYATEMHCVYVEGLIMNRLRFISHGYLCAPTETDML